MQPSFTPLAHLAQAALLAAATLHGAAAQANTLTVAGSNVAGPALYAGYAAFRYDFRLDGPGVYTFETGSASFDTFIELHPGSAVLPLGSFNPIAFDDDGSSTACGAFFCSKIASLPLPAGDYSLFVRGSSGEVGSFNLVLSSVQGADISPVPEPAPLALLAAGLAVLQWRRMAMR